MFIPSELLTAIVAGVSLVVGGTITAMLARKTHREVTTAQLWERLEKMENRERIRDDYIFKLRGQIVKLGGEPIPFPEGLTSSN